MNGMRMLPFLLVLSTVFVVNNDLANGVVSGKYFWFYGSMGLVGLATLVVGFYRRGRRERKEARRILVLDVLVLCFFASVFLSALVFNNASQNTTKLTLLALLLVLYFSFCLVCHCGLDPQSPEKRSIQNLFCIFIIVTGLFFPCKMQKKQKTHQRTGFD
jgi:drug/metabolite transporter (DMT)-like permease